MIGWLFSPVSLVVLSLTFATAVVAWARLGKIVATFIVLVGVSGLVSTYQLASIPLPAEVRLPQPSEVYDRHGRLIGTLSDVRRFIIDTKRLPRYVGNAVVAAEDRDFYRHGGVSLRGVLRAAWANVTSGSFQQGGSTITQQYVKNALLNDRSRTISRKVKEAVLAIKLEDRYSKNRILDLYLNTIYFGRGAYGIEAAARTYFDKHADKLSLGQAALLAGLIRAPETLQPGASPERARAARDRVLKAMEDKGFIGERRRERAASAPLNAIPDAEGRAGNVQAAYFMEWLRRDILYPRFKECLYTCGLKIHTTLDLDMQGYAEEAVASVLERPSDPQTALVAMTPRGEVRALVGGRGFHGSVAASGFNFAADLPGRHAGSAFKPFTLLAAIEAGISPGSAYSGASPLRLEDGPCGGAKRPWTVANYGGSSYGQMSLSSATAASVNTVFAQLASDVGPRALARLVGRFGFDRAGTDGTREIPPYCSLALGALAVTPLEMARAYAALAGEGVLPGVVPVRYVTDEFNHCLVSFVAPGSSGCDEAVIGTPSRVVSKTSAATAGNVLAGVVTGGTGTRADIGRPAAGKTGTSQNNTDAWFAGYVPQLAAAVWMGYPAEKGGRLVPQMRECSNKERCRPVQGAAVTGGGLPARVWALFMKKATRGLTDGPGAQPEVTQAAQPNYAHPPSPDRSSEPGRPSKPPKEPPPSPPPASPPPDPLPIPIPSISP